MSRSLALSLILGSGSALAQDFVPGEVLVKFKGGSSASQVGRSLGKISSKAGRISSKALGGNANGFSFKLQAEGPIEVGALLTELRADESVEYAEPNWILRRFDASKENIRFSDDQLSQFGADFTAQTSYSQSYAPVGVTESWSQITTLSQTPDRPIVAVIDTGVDYNHKVFKNSGAIWTNSSEIAGNGIDDDGNGYVDDNLGWNFHANNRDPADDDDHGTHVAGIILGVGQNIFDTTLAPAKIQIMPLKFLGADGSGSTSDAVEAIYYAVNNGARVINNSWGGSQYSQALHDALTYAYSHGVVTVAAAGNYTRNNDTTAMFPANYPVPSQLTVAASTDSDSLASFSNYGVTMVHIAAPGSYIFSTVPDTVLSPSNPAYVGRYRFMSGTSMASPFVAGLAALVVREAPNLSGFQIKETILNSSSKISGLSSRVSQGARAQVNSAVTASKSQVSIASYQPSYVAKADSRYIASESGGTTSGGGCGLVGGLASTGVFGSGGPMGGLAVVGLILLPLLIGFAIKRSAKVPESRRKFERFEMSSSVNVKVGDQEFVGNMKTISAGGVSFEAQQMLEKGGVVNLTITSPDGSQKIDVQGAIVWSAKNEAYGVQFKEVQSGILAWTKNLVRAS